MSEDVVIGPWGGCDSLMVPGAAIFFLLVCATSTFFARRGRNGYSRMTFRGSLSSFCAAIVRRIRIWLTANLRRRYGCVALVGDSRNKQRFHGFAHCAQMIGSRPLCHFIGAPGHAIG